MRLIDIDPVIVKAKERETPLVTVELLEKLPTISPDEVRGVGRWMVTDAYPHHVYCSECFKTFIVNAEWSIWEDGDIPRNFCPNCGAKMEVSEDA